jgi:hypothetical protein
MVHMNGLDQGKFLILLEALWVAALRCGGGKFSAGSCGKIAPLPLTKSLTDGSAIKGPDEV